MRLSQLTTLLICTFWLSLLSLVGFGFWLRNEVRMPDMVRGSIPTSPTLVPPASEAWPGKEIWAGPKEAEASASISRYDLAGTFQVFDGDSQGVEAAALIDDKETGVQNIVRETDELGIFRVGSITEDRLTLLHEDRSWVLTLSGVQLIASPVREEKVEVVADNPADLPALETSRFGKKVKDNYWVLEREALKGYIDEMMEPQNMIRTVNLYRSFSQVSDQGDEEPGFQIGMKAEESFFKDMGLQDGDIIRKVNSMKMRTQRRAEYLLQQFYNDKMSAIVLDVERNGEPQQHIYLVR